METDSDCFHPQTLMKKKGELDMKKKLTSFVLAAALVMSLPVAVSAAETAPAINLEPIVTAVSDGGAGAVSPMSTSSSTISADRLSNTSGNVSAYASFSGTASKAVCYIYLQEKYGDSWRAATGVPVKTYIKTAYNTNSIAAAKTFTLKSGKVYRAKIVFTDTIGGTIYTKTRYTGSF